MSLFAQLQRLYRSDRFLFEDFHTEIVAQVLRNSPALTLEWLQRIEATALRTADHIKIDTQQILPALPGHSTASRPDISIRLVSGARKELVFVESKQDSGQGDDQLQRYADHLQAAYQREGLNQVSLVFITRDYESAEMPQWMNEGVKLNFRLARWFAFYQHLKAHVYGDGLAKQLKQFMEENHMSLGNQFRSTDLVALENFLSAKALMDEALEGEVREAAAKIFGEISSLKKVFNELRDHRRYIVYNVNWNNFGCLIGFWLPHENPDEPVWVGVRIYSNPDSSFKKEYIAAFRDWVEESGRDWKSEGLDDESGWPSVYKRKALHALMGQPDHIREIKGYFLALLEEVKVLCNTYPKLPWT